jgi:hypothetical protein
MLQLKSARAIETATDDQNSGFRFNQKTSRWMFIHLETASCFDAATGICACDLHACPPTASHLAGACAFNIGRRAFFSFFSRALGREVLLFMHPTSLYREEGKFFIERRAVFIDDQKLGF